MRIEIFLLLERSATAGKERLFDEEDPHP